MNAQRNYLKLAPNTPVVITPKFATPKGPYPNKFDPDKMQWMYSVVDNDGTEWTFYASEYLHDLIESVAYWNAVENKGEPLCVTMVQGTDRRIKYSVKDWDGKAWREVPPPQRNHNPTPPSPAAAPPAPVPPPNQSPSPASAPTPSGPAGPFTSEERVKRDDGARARELEDIMVQCYRMGYSVLERVQEPGVTLDVQTLAHCLFIQCIKEGLKPVGRHNGDRVGDAAPASVPVPQPASPQSKAANPHSHEPNVRLKKLDHAVKVALSVGVKEEDIAETLSFHDISWPYTAEELALVNSDKFRTVFPAITKLAIKVDNTDWLEPDEVETPITKEDVIEEFDGEEIKS